MIKLDAKDKKILYELDINCRQTYSQISKKIGLGREATKARINNLIEKKVISQFITSVDTYSLGIYVQKIFLNLHNIDEKKKEEIANYSINYPFVMWCVTSDGAYDLMIALSITEDQQVIDFLSDLYSKYGQHVKKRTLSKNIKGTYIPRSYLVKEKKDFDLDPDYEPKENKRKEIDEVDLKIIWAVSENPRISYLELSKKVKISADSAAIRIRKLERKKIISKYLIQINSEKIGRNYIKASLRLSNRKKAEMDKLITFCKKIPEVVHIIECLGDWDLEINFEVEKLSDFRKYILEITKEFSSLVQDHDMSIIYNVYKYNFFPKRICEILTNEKNK